MPQKRDRLAHARRDQGEHVKRAMARFLGDPRIPASTCAIQARKGLYLDPGGRLQIKGCLERLRPSTFWTEFQSLRAWLVRCARLVEGLCPEGASFLRACAHDWGEAVGRGA